MNSNTTDTQLTPVAKIPGFEQGPVLVTNIPGQGKKLGAPMSLRAAVGAARTPADKLKTLRKFYPDAKPSKVGEFEYTDPQTNERVTFNPPGMDRGDFVQGAPVIGEMVGAGLGALGGGALSGVLSMGVATAPGAIVGAGAGGMAGKELVARGMGSAFGTEDTRGLGRQAVDAGAAFASGAAGEGVGQALAPVGRAVASRLAPAMTEAGNAAARLGIPVSMAVQTGKRFFQNAEAALDSGPLSHSIVRNAQNRSTEAAGDVAGRIASTIGGGADVSRGSFTAALKNAAESVIDRFNVTREAFDAAMGKAVPGMAPSHLDNIGILSNELPQMFQGLELSAQSAIAPAKGLIDNMLADAAKNGGTVPFASLRRLRSQIGEMAYGGKNTKGEVIPGAKQALQDVYDAVTADLRIAAKAVDDQALEAGLPNPGAVQAIDIHDAYVALNRGGGEFASRPVTLETFKKMMEASGTDQPLKWAQRLIQDPAKAKALRNNIAADEWDTIAGSIFQDMGRAAPGAQNRAGNLWSPSSFLSNWDRLGPKGREAIFGGGRYANVQRPINDLARVAESLKEVKGLGNTSGTARALMIPLMMRNPKNFGVALSQAAAAKILTSPTALRTITQAITTSTQKGMGPTIARLIAIGRTDKALGDAINEYLGAAHQAGLPMPNYQGIDSLNQGSPPSVQFTPR